jgi:spore coat polysaccharide biosynthesis protein SpsF
MRLAAVIQARMGSSRLPGKVLMRLGPATVLEHVIDRAKQAGVFDAVVVATTDQPADDPVTTTAARSGALTVRGSESDVLSRFVLAAAQANADAIMRITADCPLIDPEVLAAMAERFLAGRQETPKVDPVSNARVRSFPRGLDAELFTRAALDRSAQEAREPHHREHVTPYLYERPDLFRIVDYVNAQDFSHFRWTLDTRDDFELLKRIFETTATPRQLRLADVLNVLHAHPDWAALNAHIVQKQTREG